MRPWLLILAAMLACVPAPVLAASPQLAGLARQLAGQDFADRQAAERQLASRPDAATLQSLLDLARGAEAEPAARAVRILERWMQSAPLELAIQAEEGLEQLAWNETAPQAQKARDVLSIHSDLRQANAVKALLEMGAKIDFGPDLVTLRELYNVRHDDVDWFARETTIEMLLAPMVEDEVLGDPRDQSETPGAEPAANVPKTPRQVFLTRHWKGGEAGIRLLGRLVEPGQKLVVYVVSGSGVDVHAVQAATSELDEVAVIERGPCLGVSGGGVDVCLIEKVLQGGAAEQAGVEPGDVILQAGDRPIAQFGDLVNAVASHGSGDSLILTIRRGNEIVEREVTLGDWMDVDTESDLWRPSSDLPWRRQFFPPQPLIPLK